MQLIAFGKIWDFRTSFLFGFHNKQMRLIIPLIEQNTYILKLLEYTYIPNLLNSLEPYYAFQHKICDYIRNLTK